MVHASKVPDWEAMKQFGFKELPTGFIVGKAKLVDVKKYENSEVNLKDKKKHLADSGWGTHGFVLKDAERFEKPIPAKGMLGFWDFELKN